MSFFADPSGPMLISALRSSQLYHSFDRILLLSHGRALYSGPGGFGPAEHFAAQSIVCKEGYNVADYLLDIASDPPVSSFQLSNSAAGGTQADPGSSSDEVEKGLASNTASSVWNEPRPSRWWLPSRTQYVATFLTQLEVLSGREWKILRRDKTLFLAHVGVASVLGVACGMYINFLLLL